MMTLLLRMGLVLGMLLLALLPVNAANLLGVDVKVGGDAYVRGFSKDTNNQTKDQGFANLIRVKMDMITTDKIKVSTRTILSGDRWDGDGVENAVKGNSTGTAAANAGGNSVRLDYGFIEVPLPGQVYARAGRQEANFSDCFNTCDSRRDRLLLMKFMGNFVPALVYDKRLEGTDTDAGDDADMYAAALFHIHPVHEWALLYATWHNEGNDYFLNNVHNFSPYYKYKGENFKALAVYNWLGQGSETTSALGQLYPGHHHSFALKGEYRLSDRFEVGAQFIKTINGGLIAAGYDAYSFVVNNDPDNNRSNTRLVNMGGLGTFNNDDQIDEHFAVARVRSFIGPVTLSAVVGQARENIGGRQDDVMVYDAQVHYQYSKSLLLKSGVALVRGDRNEQATLFQMETAF